MNSAVACKTWDGPQMPTMGSGKEAVALCQVLGDVWKRRPPVLDLLEASSGIEAPKRRERKRYSIADLVGDATPEEISRLHEGTCWAQNGSPKGQELG